MADDGMSDEQRANLTEIERAAKVATDELRQAIDDGDITEMISAFGKTVSALGETTGTFGTGLGDTLEQSAQKAFGSEDVGSGTLRETGEAFFAVTGEATEAVAEVTAGVAEVAMTVTGGVIEAVGGTAGGLYDAGSSLVHGDIGEAAEHLADAAKSAAGIVETGIDTVAATVGVAGEVVEGAVEIGVEVVEGGVEIGVGLARDAYDAGSWAVGQVESLVTDVPAEAPVIDLAVSEEPIGPQTTVAYESEPLAPVVIEDPAPATLGALPDSSASGTDGSTWGTDEDAGAW